MTTLEKVAKAITEEIRRQNVDPFGITNYSAVVPSIKWDNVARAAIEALRNSNVLDFSWQKMESNNDNWNNALGAILNEHDDG